MRALFSAVMASTLLLAGAAAAQTPPTTDEATEVEDITVSTSVQTAVRNFVETVGTAPRDRNLARWDRRVCIGVVNLSSRYAQALVDQISAVAMVVGLDAGDPGCRPDILILADSDGDRLARGLVANDPQIFRPDIGNTNLGRAALARFQTSGAPVRWWHVTQTVSTDTGEAATGGAGIQVRGASRLRSNVREDMRNIIIILDTSRIGTISFASLGDYVSMVALAQVDDRADTTGYDTVLNLFAEGTPPTQRMTQWDLDYLQALYGANGDAMSDRRQRNEIADEVLRRRAVRPAEDEPEAAD